MNTIIDILKALFVVTVDLLHGLFIVIGIIIGICLIIVTFPWSLFVLMLR